MSNNSKKPKQRVYSIAASAQRNRKDGTVQLAYGSRIVFATSDQEAVTLASFDYVNAYPTKAGWHSHDIAASEISQEVIQKIKEIYR